MGSLDVWHGVVERRDAAALEEVLADDVVFHSPIVHTPQGGKALARLYLTAALHVLGNESFRYVREVANEREAALECVTEVDGVQVNGVDLIRWGEDGRIVDFKVMLRPLKAIQLMHRLMAQMLEKAGK